MTKTGLFTRAAPPQLLRSASGGRMDRGTPVSFTFDGRTYQGYEGDTLASALLAEGAGVAAGAS